jgi:hypothetical protein
MQRELDLLGADYLADDCIEVYGSPLRTRMYDSSAATVAATLRGASSRSVPLSKERPLFAAMDLPSPSLKKGFFELPPFANRIAYCVRPTAANLRGPGASTMSAPLFADVDPHSIRRKTSSREASSRYLPSTRPPIATQQWQSTHCVADG